MPNWWLDANWSLVGAVGLFSGGAGAQMVGFLSDTQPSANTTNLYPTYPDDDAVLDMDDKFNMQEPAAGRWSESSYDIANCATKVAGPVIGSGNNYGVWFDRDGVDIYQAAMWGSVNYGTYNTDGIYNVVLTFDRTANDPGKGFVCATVNGIPTGFYAPPGWDNAQPDFYPAGISFSATPEQMRTMEVVATEGDPGIHITNLTVSGSWTFDGFYRPVDNPPTMNTVKAGQAIPVKFSLNGDLGLDIFAADYPASYQIACDTSAPIYAIEQTVTAGGSSLQYDVLTDTYTYVWKTNKEWAGTCRQLNVMLADGSSHLANFQFK